MENIEITYQQVLDDPREFLKMTTEEAVEWLDRHLSEMNDVQIYEFEQLVIQPIAMALGEDTVLKFFKKAYPNIDEEINALECKEMRSENEE